MSKDGPPSSSGYRFGGLEAFRSGLPPKAANPRPRTDADLEAGENLAAFTDYFGRVGSIGQPLPSTQGISPERAAVFQKIQHDKLAQSQSSIRSFVVHEIRGIVLKMYICGDQYWFIKTFPNKTRFQSVNFSSREAAILAYENSKIRWIKELEKDDDC